MANNKKSPITQRDALAFAADVLANVDVIAYLADAMGLDATTATNAGVVLAKMAAQKAKPTVNNDPDGFTKARRESNAEVEACYEFMLAQLAKASENEEEETRGCVTSNAIRDAIPSVLTTQKAVKLAGYLINEGRAERVHVGSKVYYRALAQ